jgi:hypothetical protein
MLIFCISPEWYAGLPLLLKIFSSTSSVSSDINLDEQLCDSVLSKKSLYIEEDDDDDDDEDLSILDVLRVLLKGEKIEGENNEVK